MPVSKEEFQEWLLNPVTKALKEQYEADLERLKASWASGEFASDNSLDAKVRGQCEIMSQFLALELSDLESEG